jgi:hypothetical protein
VTGRLSLAATLAGLACGGATQAPAPDSPTASVQQFLAAVKANDLQRMGRLWGTNKGPAADWMDQRELYQRLTVIQKYLAHEGSRVLEGPLPSGTGQANVRGFRVELQRPRCALVLPIDVVRTGSGGWVVLDVHLADAGNPVAPCTPPGGGTGP